MKYLWHSTLTRLLLRSVNTYPSRTGLTTPTLVTFYHVPSVIKKNKSDSRIYSTNSSAICDFRNLIGKYLLSFKYQPSENYSELKISCTI